VPLEVALVEDQVQQVDDVDLHCVVLLLDHVIESLDQRLNYNVRYFIGDAAVLLYLLEDKLHEFTS
jgi:hypothetical protein